MKAGGGFASRAMMIFVLLMAFSFIVSVLLGIVMALKLGRSRRAAVYCLAAGVIGTAGDRRGYSDGAMILAQTSSAVPVGLDGLWR